MSDFVAPSVRCYQGSRRLLQISSWWEQVLGALGVGLQAVNPSCAQQQGGGGSCNRSGVGICSVTGHNLINAKNVYI